MVDVFVCPICDRRFGSLGSFQVHAVMWHPQKWPFDPIIIPEKEAPPPPVYTCEICGATFSSAEALYWHKEEAHPELYPPPPPERPYKYQWVWQWRGQDFMQANGYPSKSRVESDIKEQINVAVADMPLKYEKQGENVRVDSVSTRFVWENTYHKPANKRLGTPELNEWNVWGETIVNFSSWRSLSGSPIEPTTIAIISSIILAIIGLVVLIVKFKIVETIMSAVTDLTTKVTDILEEAAETFPGGMAGIVGVGAGIAVLLLLYLISRKR